MSLYAFYNLSTDIGTPDEYASCFTENATVKFDGETFKQGREVLRKFKELDQSSRSGKYRRHWNGSIHLVKVAPNTIHGRCYLQAFNGVPGQAPVLSDVCVYDDVIAREGGEWKFETRSLLFDYRDAKRNSQLR